ncbi:hypothetical protein D3C81_806460 [compost metagenome]
MQGGECVDLFAGHEVAIRGDQQDWRAEGGAQTEQAFGAVGDEHVGCQAKQWVIHGTPFIVQPPARQQTVEQFAQSAAGGRDGNDFALERNSRCTGMAGQWQIRAELAAKTRLGADCQAPLHGFAKVVGQGQAQPGAAKLAGNTDTGLGEGLQDFDLGILRDADAGVAHFDSDAVAERRQAHVDPPETGELEGVGQQVTDDLPHPGRIAEHQCREMRIDQAGQFDAGGGVLRQQVGGVFDQRAQVEGDVFEFELAGIELRQIENIVEQFHQHFARVMGDRQLLLLFGIERSVEG